MPLSIRLMWVVLGTWVWIILGNMRYLKGLIDLQDMVGLTGIIMEKGNECSWNTTSFEMNIFPNLLRPL